MIFQLLRNGVTADDFIWILLTFPVVLISLVIHELAHGWMAKKLGDPTAKYMRRLTLNPLSHLDPLGTVSMLFFGIGWAKPVPIDPRYFKKPKKGMALVGLAGPLSNLILAFIAALLRRITIVGINAIILSASPSVGLFNTLLVVEMFFEIFEFMNISLAVFNLIPVPPFDGSRIFYSFLPAKLYFAVMKYERYILIVFLALLYTGVVSLPISFITDMIIDLFDLIFGLIFGIGG